MSRTKLILICSVLAIACLGVPCRSLAQGLQLEIFIVHVAADAQSDNMALDVFFTLVDPSGRPIPKNELRIEKASIELLGGNTEPTDANVQDPQTPANIVLLLDTSSSMSNHMEAMREAAKAAIDSAPYDFRFAIVPFSDVPFQGALIPISDFNSNHELAKADIDAIPNSGGPTCLYNALYKSIDLLQRRQPPLQERQAIILFTDGKDERLRPGGGTEICSNYDYNAVKLKATNPDFFVPIHTIGLCTERECGNINENELERMALETHAFSATGEPRELSDMFQEIMGGLDSQWVARASVFAKEGTNEATLTVNVKLRNGEESVIEDFKFGSPRSYSVPLPPPSVKIINVKPDKQRNLFILEIGVTSPELLSQVRIRLWDAKGGFEIGEPGIFDNLDTSLIHERSFERLEGGHEYVFQALALDKEGNYVETEDRSIYLDESPVTVPQSEVVQFLIDSVKADFANDKLFIDLKVLNGDLNQVYLYEGSIFDEVQNSPIHNFEPALFTGTSIVVEPLPDQIKNATEPRSYEIRVNLITKDEQVLTAEPYRDFSPELPQAPGLWGRIWAGVTANPWVPTAIIVIALSATLVIVLRNRPAKRQSLPAPRPPIDQTLMSVSRSTEEPARTQTAPLKLRLEVLRTPNQAQRIEKIITQFPFVIGRTECDLNLTEDRRVSRRHAEITVADGKIFITDLKSRNGTFVGDEKLEPGTPKQLNGSTIVRLSRQTELKLEPQ